MAGGGIIRALFGDLARTVPMALKAASPYLEAGGRYVADGVAQATGAGVRGGWAAAGKGVSAVRGLERGFIKSQMKAVASGAASFNPHMGVARRLLNPVGGFAYMGLGAAGWAMTGDSNFMLLGAGMTAGNKALMAMGKKAWTGSSMLGMGVGIATGDPGTGAIAAVGAKGAAWAGRGTFGRRGVVGGGQLARGLGQAMWPGGGPRGAATLASVRNPAWGGLFLGAVAGGATATSKIFKNGRSDPTAGYYPGGVSQVPERSGRKMGANFLSTTGLTLSLHKHGRSTGRVV